MPGLSLAASIGLGFASGHFALRLDGANAAELTLLSNYEGGDIHADVISMAEAGSPFARKHLGPPKYDAFAIPVGIAMAPGLFGWIAGSWGAHPDKRDGAVLGVDAGFKVKTEADFAGALVVETGIPTLDTASKQAGYLTVRFQPEFIDVKPGAGKLSLALAKQKLWRTSNFRLEIDGLDCMKVSRIDAFTVTRKVDLFSSGSGGRPVLVAGRLDFPNLRITLAQAGSETWADWHESFVVNGNNGDGFERNGSIRFLSADLKTELSRIDLLHLGIVRLAQATGGGSGALAKMTAELYCEQMVLSQPGGKP